MAPRSPPAASARETIQLTLPRTVLISPLCAMRRNGCASDHRGIVFVLKRRVRAEAPVVDGELGHVVFRLEVRVEELEGGGVDHALVDGRFGGTGSHVQLLVAVPGAAEAAAVEVERALEVALRARRRVRGRAEEDVREVRAAELRGDAADRPACRATRRPRSPWPRRPRGRPPWRAPRPRGPAARRASCSPCARRGAPRAAPLGAACPPRRPPRGSAS